MVHWYQTEYRFARMNIPLRREGDHRRL